MTSVETNSGADIDLSIEMIDQHKADEYLRKGGHNRPLSPAHLLDLEGRQRRGEWRLNVADAIVFDVNDELRNGQHRLQMVLATGIPMEAVVVKNAPADAFMVYDDGRKRSIGDVLFINGEKESLLLGDTLKHIWAYLSRAQPGQVATKQQLTDLLERHATIRDSVAMDVSLFPRGQMDRPIIAAMHWLFRQADHERADRFIKQYITGLDYDRGDSTDASYVLREMITRYQANKRLPEITRRQKMGLFTICFNRGSESVKTLRLPNRSGSVTEIRGFPRELYVATVIGQGTLMEDADAA